ncbi:MAG: hypothetical protein ACFFD1_01425 [Candidatus Thorarchaeota archaeon]
MVDQEIINEEIIKSGRIIGVSNRHLFPELAAQLGAAIGTYLGKGSVVAIARDFRSDCHMIKRSTSGGLMSTGIDIIDLHSSPTSTLQFVVRKFGANSGISFTSSHYVGGEISIRLIDETGNEMDEKQVEDIIQIFSTKKFERVSNQDIGKIEQIENSIEIYQSAMQGFVNRKLIEDFGFNIVLDCSLGPTSIRVPTIISDMKSEVTTMNSYQISPKEVLPDPRSIQKVSKTVEAINAELGVVLDVEGIKAIVIDNLGRIIPPEDLASMMIREFIKERKGTIILSKYFTRRFDQDFENMGAEIVRVIDSPGNIGRTISDLRALIGATDNGKIFNPTWGPESDGTLTTLSLLEILARRKVKLNNLMMELENHRAKSTDVATTNILFHIPEKFAQKKFFNELIKKALKSKIISRDTLVGYKFEYLTGWIHFMCTPQPYEISIICETNKSEDLANITDFAYDLAKKAIENK